MYEKHPSYGMLVFNRTTGSEKTLFGSSIKHRDTITMTLRHGEIERNLNTDWYTGHDVIAEVEMSYSQFAELITSMNVGSGIPCTIRYTEKDGWLPECDFINKKEQYQNELKQKVNDNFEKSKELIDEVREIFNKKNITKKDKEQVINMLNSLSKEIFANMPYVYDCFNEQMDKTVMEAKGEVEAFMQNKINAIANMALVENKDKLLEIDKPIDIE